MTQYFYDCATKEEAKKKYRELAKKLHPDHGGSKDEFQELQKQYENFNEEKFDLNDFDEYLGKGFTDTFHKMYEDERKTYNFKFNKTNRFYGSGNSGSTTTDGRGFNKFYNANAFNKTNRDIPFDHPIHAEMANLRSQLNATKENLLKASTWNPWKQKELDKANEEIDDLKKNSQELANQIKYYEENIENWKMIARSYEKEALKNTLWKTIKNWWNR